MKDNTKTKKQLIDELTELRLQNAALNQSTIEGISCGLAVDEYSRYAESIVGTVREPLLVLDGDLKIISANLNFYKTFKVAPDETIGNFIYDLGNKQWDIPKLRELLEEILPEKEAFDDFEVEHNFQNIGHKIMLLNARQIYRKDIGSKMILLAIEDITEHKRAEESLRESERKFKEMAQTIPLAIYLSVGVEQKCEYLNTMFIKLFGYTLEDIPTVKQWWPLAYPDENYSRQISEEWTTKVQRAIETQSPIEPMEVVVTCKDGSKKNISWGYITIGDKNYAYGLDLTERKQAEEKIQQMAYHDTLTGLPNRKLFSDRLGIALAQGQRNQKKGGVAMLDLDKFKDVNDTLGHDVGDLLLKASAERLSAELRKGDTVARFGGDEFALSFPDLKEREDMIQIAQKIVDSFHMPFLIGTHQLSVTASIGIAVYPQDGTDEDILLKNADIAMYQAKQTGRDRYKLYKKA